MTCAFVLVVLAANSMAGAAPATRPADGAGAAVAWLDKAVELASRKDPFNFISIRDISLEYGRLGKAERARMLLHEHDAIDVWANDLVTAQAKAGHVDDAIKTAKTVLPDKDRQRVLRHVVGIVAESDLAAGEKLAKQLGRDSGYWLGVMKVLHHVEAGNLAAAEKALKDMPVDRRRTSATEALTMGRIWRSSDLRKAAQREGLTPEQAERAAWGYARELGEMGRPPSPAEIVRVAGQVTSPECRCGLYTLAAKQYLATKNKVAAAAALAKAVAQLPAIEEKVDRGSFQVRIAEVQVEMGLLDAAKRNILARFEAERQDWREKFPGHASWDPYSWELQWLIRAEAWDEALKVVAECARHDQPDLQSAIAEQLARDGRHARLRAWLGTLRLPANRAGAYVGIAKALRQGAKPIWPKDMAASRPTK